MRNLKIGQKLQAVFTALVGLTALTLGRPAEANQTKIHSNSELFSNELITSEERLVVPEMYDRDPNSGEFLINPQMIEMMKKDGTLLREADGIGIDSTGGGF